MKVRSNGPYGVVSYSKGPSKAKIAGWVTLYGLAAKEAWDVIAGVLW